MSLSRRTLPPLNALRSFEVAGRRLNFRAAADDLGVTQGAVAQQVRALEDHLGLALFRRLPRGLALTPQGAAYLAEVTRALDTLAAATGQLLARPEAVSLSVTPTFATRLLIPQLPELNKSLSGIELRIIATEAVSDFDRDEVDIAVRLTRPPFSSGYQAQLLFRQQLVPVGSPHLIRQTPLPLTREQMQTMPLLHDAHLHWSRYLGASATPSGAVFNQTAHALDAALAGQGLALACRAFVQADIDAGRLVQVGEANLPDGADYYLIRKRTGTRHKAANAVWNWCVEQWVVP